MRCNLYIKVNEKKKAMKMIKLKTRSDQECSTQRKEESLFGSSRASFVAKKQWSCTRVRRIFIYIEKSEKKFENEARLDSFWSVYELTTTIVVTYAISANDVTNSSLQSSREPSLPALFFFLLLGIYIAGLI